MSSIHEKYDAFRIPLEDIVNATNDFDEENLLKQGKHANVYKGLLLFRSQIWIKVVIWRLIGHRYVHRLTHVHGFRKEIRKLCRLEHKNVASYIGYCDEEAEIVIVMEDVVNGSLDRYLNDPTLTWSRRLHICYGIAHALRYLHDSSNMKGFKVMLDKDWEAKVYFSTESRRYDIESPNSAVYCMGMILLEVLYARKAAIEDVNEYLAMGAKKQYDKNTWLDDIIDPNLRKQMHTESLSIFSGIAYECLKEQPKPHSYKIEKMLKEALDIQWQHDNKLGVEKLAYLKIPLSQINMATHNFSDTHRIKSHIYKAELDQFDTESWYTVKRENKVEPQKKKVIIIRVYEKTRIEFFGEIEMLSGCKHPNLLSLLGFCDEDYEMIFVFECAFKETLDDYLESTCKTTNLTWEQRIRICLDVAEGLKCLHNMEDKSSVIHQVIQSPNVFLDKNWNAQIANFRLSDKFNSHATSLWQSRPENFRTWLWEAMKAPLEPSGQRIIVDDIYSLGVILFQILTGRFAYDPFSMVENVNGLASVALGHCDLQELKDMADPRIMKEAQDSLDVFFKIVYQCFVETLSERPTLEDVIKSLKEALQFQVQEKLRIPLEVIKRATNNFDEKYLIGSGGYGAVYKAELNHLHISSLASKMKGKCDFSNDCYTVAIKRIFSREDEQGKEGFLVELDVLQRCEHPNIVSILGFCVEGTEMLLVYEHASNGSLDNYLRSTNKIVNLAWAQRLTICIDIARGMNYLHTTMEDNKRIIHRDIKSDNILLGKNWEAKIADFGLSKLHHANQQGSTIETNNIAGTNVYMDPEYSRTGRLKKASDIYSLGVVLFEIFSGTSAYDPCYTREKEKGLAPIVRRHFKKGTLKEMLDPKIMDEASELGFTTKVQPAHDSLDAFLRIAYQCIAKTQADRPTIEVVIKELEEALYIQENWTLKISLEDIKIGTENFSDGKCIMRGGYGKLYKGKLQYNNRQKKVAVKRFSADRYSNGTSFSWENGFLKEFEVLFKYKQENIIGLIGYCKEMNEKIILYEHSSKESLDKYLKDASFSWIKRLKICIDIANGLKFLHEGGVGRDVVIHRDLKSSNILLTKDWKAKICGFEHAFTYPTNQEIQYVIDNVEGSPGYSDPLFLETHFLTKESDIYSFGVILFELLCGRLACPEDFTNCSQFLDILVKFQFQVARLDEIVFEGIKEQISPKSLTTFRIIAFRCLLEERKERPTAGDVVVQLQKALEFQEAYEAPEGIKLNRNYKEILRVSESREIYATMAKKYLKDILSKGILTEDDKLEIIRNIQQTTSTSDLEGSVPTHSGGQ